MCQELGANSSSVQGLNACVAYGCMPGKVTTAAVKAYSIHQLSAPLAVATVGGPKRETGETQLFSDPEKKGNPFLGLDHFSGAATKKKGKKIGATQLRKALRYPLEFMAVWETSLSVTQTSALWGGGTGGKKAPAATIKKSTLCWPRPEHKLFPGIPRLVTRTRETKGTC